ncbi:MAG: TolC family outer membrane protein [Hyphomonadaceae bacterium]|nr:TolC family outer membrane protein [Hyphomonadaceae bacterium]
MRLRSALFALGVCVVAPAARAETLEDAVASAFANNPTLVDARLGVRSAREDRRQASASYMPQVDFGIDFSGRILETRQRGLFGISNNVDVLDNRTIALRAVQRLYSGGRRRAEVNQAEAGINSAQEAVRQAEQEVLIRTIRVYADVLRDQANVRIRTEYAESLAQDLRGTQRRLDVGDVTRTDLSQSQARYARALAGLAQARAELEQSRASYEAVVGYPPGELAPLDTPPAPPLSLQDATREAEAINPDLLQARHEARAARSQVDVERSSLEPSIDLLGSLNYASDVTQEGDMSQSAQVTARVSIPLFEGGFYQSRIRQSRIAVERADQRTESARRAVRANVASSWYALDAAAEVVEAAHVQLGADEAALDGVRREQGVGLRSTLDVLNAQQELLDSELGVVRAERDAYVAVFELLQSMGVLSIEALGMSRAAP